MREILLLLTLYLHLNNIACKVITVTQLIYRPAVEVFSGVTAPTQPDTRPHSSIGGREQSVPAVQSTSSRLLSAGGQPTLVQRVSVW